MVCSARCARRRLGLPVAPLTADAARPVVNLTSLLPQVSSILRVSFPLVVVILFLLPGEPRTRRQHRARSPPPRLQRRLRLAALAVGHPRIGFAPTSMLSFHLCRRLKRSIRTVRSVADRRSAPVPRPRTRREGTLENKKCTRRESLHRVQDSNDMRTQSTQPHILQGSRWAGPNAPKPGDSLAIQPGDSLGQLMTFMTQPGPREPAGRHGARTQPRRGVWSHFVDAILSCYFPLHFTGKR